MTTHSLRDIYKPVHINPKPFFDIRDMRTSIASYGIDLDPDYQRGHVWTKRQKQLFVGFLLSGGEVPYCIMNSGPTGDLMPAELVDGKQRITACFEWRDDAFPAILPDGTKVTIASLLQHPDAHQYNFNKLGNIGIEIGVVRMTRLEVLELYVKLNSGGTPHTKEEIRRVRDLLAREKRKGPDGITGKR